MPFSTLNQAVKRPYPYPVQRIKLAETLEIAYADVGDRAAPVLLLVHGLGTGSPVWARNIPVLSRYFRCIIPDLPGHGFSSRGNFPFTMAFYTDVLLRFTEQLGLERVHLAGHSMGGQIALLAAVKQPELVSRLVLVAPAGLARHSALEMLLIETMTAGWVSTGNAFTLNRQNYLLGFCNNPEAADELARHMAFFKNEADDFGRMLQLSVQAMLLEPASPVLGRVKQPCLVLVGREDRLVPYQYFRMQDLAEFARQKTWILPDGELKIFSPCGHFVQYQQPEQFNEAVLSFLEEE